MINKTELSAVIDRLEEDRAVLKLTDGQTLNVSIECLPAEVGEGSVLQIFFGDEPNEKKDRAEQAKEILNEILKKNF